MTTQFACMKPNEEETALEFILFLPLTVLKVSQKVSY